MTLWTPEPTSNFETALPRMVLAIGMSWHTKANPREMLDEFYSRFYGAADEPMSRYWQFIDDC